MHDQSDDKDKGASRRTAVAGVTTGLAAGFAANAAAQSGKQGVNRAREPRRPKPPSGSSIMTGPVSPAR